MNALFDDNSDKVNNDSISRGKRGNRTIEIEEKEYRCQESLTTIKNSQGIIEPLVEISIDNFLTNRIAIYQNMTEPDDDNEIDCIALNQDTTKLTILGNLFINKYIGSGAYGVVFNNEDGNTRYAIKFIKHSTFHLNEIRTMKDISTINSSIHIPNFIYTAYYKLNCKKIDIPENNIAVVLNQCLSIDNDTGKYSMIVLEYLDGTLHQLLRTIIGNTINADNNEILKSIYSQALLSLYIFHNKFNYYHKDSHLSNFFYKKVIKDNKYFHYQINGQNYYIKNVGYLIVLADYGLAEKKSETFDLNKIHEDYKQIISSILITCLNKYRQFYIDDKIDKRKIISANFTMEDKSSFNEFKLIDDLLKYFFVITPQSIPSSSEIINSKPYII